MQLKIISRIIDQCKDNRRIKGSLLFLQKQKKTLLSLLVVGIFEDIVLRPTSSDLLTFSVLSIYIVFIFTLKIKSTFTFYICLFLLAISVAIFLFDDMAIAAEKAAVWLILFFVIGVIQQWRE